MADKKISQLSSVNPASAGLIPIVQDSATNVVTVNNLFNNIPSGLTLKNGVVSIAGTVNTYGANGAIDIITAVSNVANNSASVINMTLAAGAAGQEKTIVMTAKVNDVVVTPATAEGYTTITFTAIGQTVKLQYLNGKWTIISAYGVTVA